MSGMVDGRRIGLVAGAALLLAGGMALSVGMNLPGTEKKVAEEQQAAEQVEESNRETGVAAEQSMEMAVYPARGFSNMCGYEGKVYCGVNGIYGEEIAQKSSIFTVWEDKVYYVDKVQEAYDSVTDELLEIKRAELNGSGEEVLADDVFLAGTGHEVLCGDKLFYGYEYDDNYRMRYAYVDVNTGERKELPTDRIENILGSDENYLYYRGMDTESGEYLLGRIQLEKGEDETLFTFAAVDEVGYIENVVMAGNRLYCLTLAEKTDSYDYRTYTYRIQIRNSKDGKVEKELPTELTGLPIILFWWSRTRFILPAAERLLPYP